MGDVLEYLIDGTSGLAPGGVDGKALVAGVCSRGQVGKAYLIGKRTDLAAMLGVGPLVDRARDMLVAGGQEPLLVAVPVAGQPGGYISPPACFGGITASISGLPASNADVVVRVATSGALGTATVKISLNNGLSFADPVPTATQMPIGEDDKTTGATICFAEDTTFAVGAEIRFTVRCAVGPVKLVGIGPLLTVSGDPQAGAELVVQITKSGPRNEGTYQLSTDGGDNFGPRRTIPMDGIVFVPDVGVTIAFSESAFTIGTTYTCRVLPPVPSIVNVMEALESPLAVYDVEFVLVAGPSDSVDWAALAAKADELWNMHRPTYFKAETRLPYDGEDLSDFSTYLLAERQNMSARFVQVCCQFGEISDADGQRRLRNWAGLQAGRTISIPVQRATGRVKDGPISQGSIPEGWDAVQPWLEDAGFVTAKKYAGLAGAYWGDSRTLAEDTSDYRYEEVVRTALKAVRKMRIAALKSLYDEAGDPLRPTSNGGLAYLKAQIENALDTMTKAVPQELVAYKVSIPSGQDIANNGVAVETTIIATPIMRQIKLFAKYVYAGSKFDPRLTEKG